MNKLAVKLRILLAATLISNIGSAMSVLALGKLFYDQTGSIAGFAWAFAIEQMVQVLGLYCAGPVSDRLDSRRVAITADIIRGFVFVVSAVLVIKTGNIAFAYASVIVGGFLKPFQRAAIFRWLPTLVEGEELFRLNSAYGSAVQAGALIGSGITGALMLIMPSAYLIVIDGFSYFLSASILLSFWRSEVTPSNLDSVKEKGLVDLLGFTDWYQFIKVLRGRKDLLGLTIFNSFDYVVVGVFNVFLVPYIELVLKMGPLYISVIDGFFAAGSLLLVFSLKFFTIKAGSNLPVSVGYASMIAGFGTLAVTDHIILACMGTIFIGYGQRLVFTCNTSSLQQATPATYRGRIAVLRLAGASLLSALVVAPTATALNQNVQFGLFMFLLAITFVWVVYLALKFFNYQTARARLMFP